MYGNPDTKTSARLEEQLRLNRMKEWGVGMKKIYLMKKFIKLR